MLVQNTLATADDQIVDLQKDSAGPALDIVYGVSQAADYDPLATRFFASVYSVSSEACAYNISARLQSTSAMSVCVCVRARARARVANCLSPMVRWIRQTRRLWRLARRRAARP